MNHVLLEERGVSLIVDSASPCTVRTNRSRPSVRRHAGIDSPVFEIAELAAVQFVDGLAVHHAILASPDAVLCLADVVHVRNTPRRFDRTALLRIGQVDQPNDHDPIVALALHDLCAVEILVLRLDGLAVSPVGDAADLQPVALCKGLADPVCRDLGVDRRDTHPHALRRGVRHQLVWGLRRVDPILAAGRIFRLCKWDISHRFAIHCAQRVYHVAGALPR